MKLLNVMCQDSANTEYENRTQYLSSPRDGGCRCWIVPCFMSKTTRSTDVKRKKKTKTKNLSYFSQIFCKRQMKQKIMELYLAGLHASWYHTSLLLTIACNFKEIYAFQDSLEINL